MAPVSTLPRIGTAGWSVPVSCRHLFPDDGAVLEKYAAHFNAVEINTSFYRPHRRATYEKWASQVPEGFAFSVKLPREITHVRRLQASGDLVSRFAGEVAGLGPKLGAILVQLPPSLAFQPHDAGQVFHQLRHVSSAPIVCEPRHPSWFSDTAGQFLMAHHVARVAADPAPVAAAAEPGGSGGIAYFRLHGSPRMYYSDYSAEDLEGYSQRLEKLLQAGRGAWCIFDNTAVFAAMPNAMSLMALCGGGARQAGGP